METDYPVLAEDRVRYVGEAVALVVATSRYIAEDAADLVDVTYEELPAVVDAEHAMTSASPRLFDEYESNIFITRELTAGDPKAAFRDADLVVRHRFHHPASHRHSHGATRKSGGVPRGASGAHEWASHQTPHLLRTGLSECLGIPERRIRVIAPDVGGGFASRAICIRTR